MAEPSCEFIKEVKRKAMVVESSGGSELTAPPNNTGR
ncbi:hypothetical protein COLO4_35589 [Corchorus olitorius]|uniref:Uncharacterized protein n=1 Tax=Corchorus olitorius TaxID=93759 RepID=A0A1R3GEY5_9ROSI|nr:hypothetical protein COLO4_35589 [Corchorus olitorius]